ncbi:MAG: YraN family protein [Hespellia sp.]|nr:YraN family protein [Hespellia sp.]
MRRDGNTQNKRAVGAAYERLASQYLEESGYRILEQNYRCRSGEIDLIALDGEYLVFCEVKYRKNLCTGHPLEAVNEKKQRIISKCAGHYIMGHHLGDRPCRFDVIGICGEEITLVKNAFEFLI